MVYAQRLGEWLTNAPQIEEDMALANVSLDLLGQARGLYAHIGELDGTGRSEDDFAMLRDERQWRNVHLVEQERADFGFEMARLLWFSAYQVELYAAAAGSSDETFRAVAAKATKEVALPPRPCAPVGGAARRRHRGVARSDAGRPSRPYSLTWQSCSTTTRCRRRGGRGGGRSAAVGAPRRGRRPRVAAVVSEATLTLPERLALAVARRAAGRPLGADGVPPRRDAARRPVAPGGDVVTTTRTAPGELEAAVGSIPDPEVPVVTIADLGILRSVAADETTGVVDVVITPTYSGCPAMEAITAHVSFVCHAAGWEPRVTTRLSPAWTTDWMSDDGKEKLRRFGIAPPTHTPAGGPVPVALGGGPSPVRAAVETHGGAGAVRVDGVQGAAPAL